MDGVGNPLRPEDLSGLNGNSPVPQVAGLTTEAAPRRINLSAVDEKKDVSETEAVVLMEEAAGRPGTMLDAHSLGINWSFFGIARKLRIFMLPTNNPACCPISYKVQDDVPPVRVGRRPRLRCSLQRPSQSLSANWVGVLNGRSEGAGSPPSEHVEPCICCADAVACLFVRGRARICGPLDFECLLLDFFLACRLLLSALLVPFGFVCATWAAIHTGAMDSARGPYAIAAALMASPWFVIRLDEWLHGSPTTGHPSALSSGGPTTVSTLLRSCVSSWWHGARLHSARLLASIFGRYVSFLLTRQQPPSVSLPRRLMLGAGVALLALGVICTAHVVLPPDEDWIDESRARRLLWELMQAVICCGALLLSYLSVQVTCWVAHHGVLGTLAGVWIGYHARSAQGVADHMANASAVLDQLLGSIVANPERRSMLVLDRIVKRNMCGLEFRLRASSVWGCGRVCVPRSATVTLAHAVESYLVTHNDGVDAAVLSFEQLRLARVPPVGAVSAALSASLQPLHLETDMLTLGLECAPVGQIEALRYAESRLRTLLCAAQSRIAHAVRVRPQAAALEKAADEAQRSVGTTGSPHRMHPLQSAEMILSSELKPIFSGSNDGQTDRLAAFLLRIDSYVRSIAAMDMGLLTAGLAKEITFAKLWGRQETWNMQVPALRQTLAAFLDPTMPTDSALGLLSTTMFVTIDLCAEARQARHLLQDAMDRLPTVSHGEEPALNYLEQCRLTWSMYERYCTEAGLDPIVREGQVQSGGHRSPPDLWVNVSQVTDTFIAAQCKARSSALMAEEWLENLLYIARTQENAECPNRDGQGTMKAILLAKCAELRQTYGVKVTDEGGFGPGNHTAFALRAVTMAERILYTACNEVLHALFRTRNLRTARAFVKYYLEPTLNVLRADASFTSISAIDGVTVGRPSIAWPEGVHARMQLSNLLRPVLHDCAILHAEWITLVKRRVGLAEGVTRARLEKALRAEPQPDGAAQSWGMTSSYTDNGRLSVYVQPITRRESAWRKAVSALWPAHCVQQTLLQHAQERQGRRLAGIVTAVRLIKRERRQLEADADALERLHPELTTSRIGLRLHASGFDAVISQVFSTTFGPPAAAGEHAAHSALLKVIDRLRRDENDLMNTLWEGWIAVITAEKPESMIRAPGAGIPAATILLDGRAAGLPAERYVRELMLERGTVIPWYVIMLIAAVPEPPAPDQEHQGLALAAFNEAVLVMQDRDRSDPRIGAERRIAYYARRKRMQIAEKRIRDAALRNSTPVGAEWVVRQQARARRTASQLLMVWSEWLGPRLKSASRGALWAISSVGYWLANPSTMLHVTPSLLGATIVWQVVVLTAYAVLAIAIGPLLRTVWPFHFEPREEQAGGSAWIVTSSVLLLRILLLIGALVAGSPSLYRVALPMSPAADIVQLAVAEQLCYKLEATTGVLLQNDAKAFSKVRAATAAGLIQMQTRRNTILENIGVEDETRIAALARHVTVPIVIPAMHSVGGVEVFKAELRASEVDAVADQVWASSGEGMARKGTTFFLRCLLLCTYVLLLGAEVALAPLAQYAIGTSPVGRAFVQAAVLLLGLCLSAELSRLAWPLVLAKSTSALARYLELNSDKVQRLLFAYKVKRGLQLNREAALQQAGVQSALSELVIRISSVGGLTAVARLHRLVMAAGLILDGLMEEQFWESEKGEEDILPAERQKLEQDRKSVVELLYKASQACAAARDGSASVSSVHNIECSHTLAQALLAAQTARTAVIRARTTLGAALSHSGMYLRTPNTLGDRLNPAIDLLERAASLYSAVIMNSPLFLVQAVIRVLREDAKRDHDAEEARRLQQSRVTAHDRTRLEHLYFQLQASWASVHEQLHMDVGVGARDEGFVDRTLLAGEYEAIVGVHPMYAAEAEMGQRLRSAFQAAEDCYSFAEDLVREYPDDPFLIQFIIQGETGAPSPLARAKDGAFSAEVSQRALFDAFTCVSSGEETAVRTQLDIIATQCAPREHALVVTGPIGSAEDRFYGAGRRKNQPWDPLHRAALRELRPAIVRLGSLVAESMTHLPDLAAANTRVRVHSEMYRGEQSAKSGTTHVAGFFQWLADGVGNLVRNSLPGNLLQAIFMSDGTAQRGQGQGASTGQEVQALPIHDKTVCLAVLVADAQMLSFEALSDMQDRQSAVRANEALDERDASKWLVWAEEDTMDEEQLGPAWTVFVNGLCRASNTFQRLHRVYEEHWCNVCTCCLRSRIKVPLRLRHAMRHKQQRGGRGKVRGDADLQPNSALLTPSSHSFGTSSTATPTNTGTTTTPGSSAGLTPFFNAGLLASPGGTLPSLGSSTPGLDGDALGVLTRDEGRRLVARAHVAGFPFTSPLDMPRPVFNFEEEAATAAPPLVHANAQSGVDAGLAFASPSLGQGWSPNKTFVAQERDTHTARSKSRSSRSRSRATIRVASNGSMMRVTTDSAGRETVSAITALPPAQKQALQVGRHGSRSNSCSRSRSRGGSQPSLSSYSQHGMSMTCIMSARELLPIGIVLPGQRLARDEEAEVPGMGRVSTRRSITRAPGESRQGAGRSVSAPRTGYGSWTGTPLTPQEMSPVTKAMASTLRPIKERNGEGEGECEDATSPGLDWGGEDTVDAPVGQPSITEGRHVQGRRRGPSPSPQFSNLKVQDRDRVMRSHSLAKSVGFDLAEAGEGEGAFGHRSTSTSRSRLADSSRISKSVSPFRGQGRATEGPYGGLRMGGQLSIDQDMIASVQRTAALFAAGALAPQERAFLGGLSGAPQERAVAGGPTSTVSVSSVLVYPLAAAALKGHAQAIASAWQASGMDGEAGGDSEMEAEAAYEAARAMRARAAVHEDAHAMDVEILQAIVAERAILVAHSRSDGGDPNNAAIEDARADMLFCEEFARNAAAAAARAQEVERRRVESEAAAAIVARAAAAASATASAAEAREVKEREQAAAEQAALPRPPPPASSGDYEKDAAELVEVLERTQAAATERFQCGEIARDTGLRHSTARGPVSFVALANNPRESPFLRDTIFRAVRPAMSQLSALRDVVERASSVLHGALQASWDKDVELGILPAGAEAVSPAQGVPAAQACGPHFVLTCDTILAICFKSCEPRKDPSVSHKGAIAGMEGEVRQSPYSQLYAVAHLLVTLFCARGKGREGASIDFGVRVRSRYLGMVFQSCPAAVPTAQPLSRRKDASIRSAFFAAPDALASQLGPMRSVASLHAAVLQTRLLAVTGEDVNPIGSSQAIVLLARMLNRMAPTPAAPGVANRGSLLSPQASAAGVSVMMACMIDLGGYTLGRAYGVQFVKMLKAIFVNAAVRLRGFAPPKLDETEQLTSMLGPRDSRDVPTFDPRAVLTNEPPVLTTASEAKAAQIAASDR